MSRYHKSSDYYPDDKDIYDYLSSTGAPLTSMLDFLAEYGIFCSEKDSKENVQDYLSYLYLSWPTAVNLLELTDGRDTDDHLTSSELDLAATMDSVRASVEAVKKRRAEREREAYEIRFVGEDEIDITVDYVDVDTSRTRILQKRHRSLNICITHTPDKLYIQHTSLNARAMAIIQNFLGEVAAMEKADADKIKPKYISLAKILSPEIRVQFFKDIMNSVVSFDLKDVIHIRVGRMKKELRVDGGDGDDDDDVDIDVEDTVSKVIIYGTQLFQSNEFQALVAKGFFITSATWKSELTEESPSQVEFIAGFTDSDTYENFSYKVVGKFPALAGIIQSKRDKLPASSVKEYTRRLENASRLAYQAAVKKSP